MAFGCLTLAVLMAGGLVWRSAQSIVTPYVIEVDNAGQVRAVGEAATPYQPSDAQIAYHLGRFIGLVRSLSIDPIVVRQNWLDAYDYTTDKGAVVLNEYARVADPFSRIGKESVTVQVSSVTRASDQSFNVRWTETRFVNGALDRTERWNAVISTVLQTPRTEQRVRKNPLNPRTFTAGNVSRKSEKTGALSSTVASNKNRLPCAMARSFNSSTA